MTLSPVFRSARAIAVLQSETVWSRLEEAAVAQHESIQRVRADLPRVLDRRFVIDDPAASTGTGRSLDFVQTFFFLILFRSVLQSIGIRRPALDFYSELNFCIQGTIVAADNLFDDERKLVLPLQTGTGTRFGSILQLLAFQRLMSSVFDRAITGSLIQAADRDVIQRELMSRMADIGTLEGSEEAGIEDIDEVDTMLERVHRVRGGQLFALSLIAPAVAEPTGHRAAITETGRAISRLGTAFQIVDDLTDFEFDVRHRRQNLLAAQIHQAGTPQERTTLRQMRHSRAPFTGLEPFVYSARAVLERARAETRRSLEELAAVGFWWPPRLADELVYAIVGLDGLAAMELASGHLQPESPGART